MVTTSFKLTSNKFKGFCKEKYLVTHMWKLFHMKSFICRNCFLDFHRANCMISTFFVRMPLWIERQPSAEVEKLEKKRIV